MPFTSTLPVSLEGNSGSRTLWKYPCPSHVPSHRIWTLHCLGNWCNLQHWRLSATFGMECLGRLHAVEQGVPTDTHTESAALHQMLPLEKEEVEWEMLVIFKIKFEKKLLTFHLVNVMWTKKDSWKQRVQKRRTLHHCTPQNICKCVQDDACLISREVKE